jgi:amino-acid N-acetyltransferase
MTTFVSIDQHGRREAVPYKPQELRTAKALLADARDVMELINSYAAQGIMLPRTEFEMAENIRDFSVIFSGDRLVACGALHFYSTTTAEIRSLAVDPNWKAHGLGRLVMRAVEAEAVEHGVSSLFAFTYVPSFFRKLGYAEVERGDLPLKAWKDCLRCPKFQACDEIAMLKRL